MTAERSTGGKRPPRRPPVKRPDPEGPAPVLTVTLTSPQGTRAHVPADLADKMRRQGWK